MIRGNFKSHGYKVKGEYYKKSTHVASSLALRCLNNDPQDRPSMAEVLFELEQVKAIKKSPLGTMDHAIKERKSVEIKNECSSIFLFFIFHFLDVQYWF